MLVKRFWRRHSTILALVGLMSFLFLLYQLSRCISVAYTFNLTKIDTCADGREVAETHADDCKVLHIAIVCAGYKAPLRAHFSLIKSLLFHRKSPLHFHFVVDDMSEKILATLFDTWRLPSVNVSFYHLSAVVKEVDWIENKHYSGIYGLLKLVLHELLPISLDRVLVLDTDILAVSPFSYASVHKYFDQMTKCSSRCIFGLVENLSNWYLGNMWMDHVPWPALNRGFNTGVIFMNLSAMRRRKWSAFWKNITRQHLAIYGAVALADQDIFNAAINSDHTLVHILPCEWNLQLGDRSVPDLCKSSLGDLKFVHFNSPRKVQVSGRYAEVYKQHYSSFAQMDGSLLQRELLHCSNDLMLANANNVSSYTYYDEYGDYGGIDNTNGQLNENEFINCNAFRNGAKIVHRVHLFALPFNYQQRNMTDVCLVTQMSTDRMTQLEALAQYWDGPISISIYLTDLEATQFEQMILNSMDLQSRKNIAYHFVFRQGPFYPVNSLRNTALKNAPCSHVFLNDIDFIPSSGLYMDLKSHIEAYGQDMQNQALVIPAFETSFKCATMDQNEIGTMLRSKQELLDAWDLGKASVFRGDIWPAGHAPTDYDRWRVEKNPYQVDWQPEYEPYIVVSKKNLPLFDTRFIGFGWNKVAYAMRLHAESYSFSVLPSVYVVHRWHTASKDLLSFRSKSTYRKCLRIIKGEFIKELTKERLSRMN